jgi:hypothetical protein
MVSRGAGGAVVITSKSSNRTAVMIPSWKMARAGSKSVFLSHDPLRTSRIDLYWMHLRVLENSRHANP